jgi:hypothetical protein
LSAISSGAVEFATIPVEAVGARNERGQSIITVDTTKVKDFVAQLLGRSAPKFSSPGMLRLNGAAAQPATIDGVRCVD